MENVTLFHCIILILAFLYEFTANRTLNYKLLFSFMIATIGTIIMFSNPNYRKILFEGSEYQQVSNNQGIFFKICRNDIDITSIWCHFQSGYNFKYDCSAYYLSTA